MMGLGKLWRRLSFWLHRDRIEADLREEIETHRALRERSLVDAGSLAPAADSRRLLGNVVLAREDARAVWLWPWLESVFLDVRQGARALRRNPSFTVTALLTIAIGSGALTAVFAVVHTVLLKPTPYANDDRIVQILQVRGGRPRSEIAAVDVEAVRARATGLETTTFAYISGVNLTGASLPENARAVYTDRHAFPLLGTQPLIGRWPTADDEKGDAEPIVVLSHHLWQRRYQGRQSVLGEPLTINGRSHTIIAVMPDGFVFPAPYYVRGDLWIFREPTHPSIIEPARAIVLGFGLLKNRETLAGVQSEVDAIALQLAEEYPDAHANIGLRLMEWAGSMRQSSRQTLSLLLAAAGAVFLIVCINIFNLLLCRGLDRGAEMSTRTALGAGGTRLVRHVLTETVVLFALGGAAGTMFALWLSRGIVSISTFDIPRLDETSLDWKVALAGFAITAVAGLVVGLIPAVRATRTASIGASATRAMTHGRQGRRVQRLLIASEIGLAVVLACAAAAIAGNVYRWRAVDAGFDATGVVQARVSLPATRYPDIARQASYFEDVLVRLRSHPEISAASVVDLPPGVAGGPSPAFTLDRDPMPTATRQLRGAAVRVVSDGYFETLGLAAREGRLIKAADRSTPLTAVVNEAFVREYLNGNGALGRGIRVTLDGLQQLDPVDRTIVGVVPDIREDVLYRPAPPAIYIPMTQASARRVALVVRSASTTGNVSRVIRESLVAVDSDQGVNGLVMPLGDLMRSEFSRNRFSLILVGGLALTAMILAVVGVYGVTAHGVRHRSREIGIRLALGVAPGSVRRLVILEGGVLLAAGVAAGSAIALWMLPLVGSLVVGLDTVPVAGPLAAAAVLMTLAVLSGCDIPARRAAKVDPVTALRSE